MNNRKVFIFIISLLIVVEIASVFLAWNSFNNKPQIKDEIKNNSKTSILAIMLEQSDGTYEKSECNGWPSSSNYSYNGVASKCLDVDENEISEILSFNSATFSIRPVFLLSSESNIIGGSGKINDPFINKK